MNVFILLSIHSQFIINALSILTVSCNTSFWHSQMNLYCESAWYKICALSPCPFCTPGGLSVFLWATLDSRILPPACTENKREGEEQKCSCHHDHSDFPNACVAPTMWTCTLPLCYAFALAHRAISAIGRAVGLRLVQASTGDWTKSGQWAKESVLSIM